MYVIQTVVDYSLYAFCQHKTGLHCVKLRLLLWNLSTSSGILHCEIFTCLPCSCSVACCRTWTQCR